jgi:chromate transporter
VLWVISAAAFIAIYLFEVPFPAIVICAGIIGFIGGHIAPRKFATGGGHADTKKSYGPALIDDDTSTPPHARFHWSGFGRVVATGVLLWLVTLGALALARGWDDALNQMGWFFTKTALLTFGGAYAVLPYVVQGAVEHY